MYASNIWCPHLAYYSNDNETPSNHATCFILSLCNRSTSVSGLKKQVNLSGLQLHCKVQGLRICLLHIFYGNPGLMPDVVTSATTILPKVNDTCELDRVKCPTRHHFRDNGFSAGNCVED